MKISGISKILGSVGLVALLSSNAIAGSKLAGIELGSDYKQGCEKLKTLFEKKETKIVFKSTDKKCGTEWGMEWVGLKTKDGSTIEYIGVKHTTFGYPFFNDAKDVSQDYTKTLNAVSHILDFEPQNNWYTGTNLLGTERVTISNFVIAISKVEDKTSFDIK